MRDDAAYGRIHLTQAKLSARRCDQFFQMCIHLWENQRNSSSGARDYYRCFSGRELRRDLLCKVCGIKVPQSNGPMVWVCEECFIEAEENGQRLGDWGIPGFLVRDAGLQLTSTALQPLPDGAGIVEVAPIHSQSGSHWLALTNRHELLRIDLSGRQINRICGVTDLGLPMENKFSIITSRAGDFAAITTQLGATGAVVELASGKVSMILSRGDYHNEHCQFPVAFFEHEGKTLLVHGTSWNRLDISNPSTGELLTPRGPTSYKSGEEMPPHYLDYFHCGLAVSPDGEWIADNGWVWAPFGVVRTWSLRDWLTRNVWESEDGPSMRSDVCRGYYWDGSICWSAKNQLAVWGVGKDDYSLLPAVRLIDVTNGNEPAPIIGPFGPAVAAITPEIASHHRTLAKNGVMEFDGYLFAWSPASGFSAWDIADGARVLQKHDFCPLAYNRSTQEFFSQDAAGIFHVSKLTSR